MDIHITSGVGTGPTKMAAFDLALNHAGIANYNLIRLSSIIPPGSRIIEHEEGALSRQNDHNSWGDRLYLVLAEMRTDTPHQEVWAGVGWVQDPETGKGLFTEHEGHSQEAVKREIRSTLKALMATRNMKPHPIHMRVTGRICTHEPVGALVAAVYQSVDWQQS